MVGGTIPRLVVLGSKRKQVDRASKQHSSIAFALASSLRFLPCLMVLSYPVLTSFSDEQ